MIRYGEGKGDDDDDDGNKRNTGVRKHKITWPKGRDKQNTHKANHGQNVNKHGLINMANQDAILQPCLGHVLSAFCDSSPKSYLNLSRQSTNDNWAIWCYGLIAKVVGQQAFWSLVEVVFVCMFKDRLCWLNVGWIEEKGARDALELSCLVKNILSRSASVAAPKSRLIYLF